MNRRTYLTLAAGGIAGTVLTGSATATGGLGFTNVGVNRFDIDGDGTIDVDAEQVRRSVRFFSEGPTADYITSAANVDDEGITLGAFTGSAPATLTYEYRGGANNEVSVPDEVWLRLVETDGTTHEVYRSENDGDPDAQEWRTRNVHREIRGNPDFNQGFDWFEVDSSGVTNLGAALTDDFTTDTQIDRVAAGRGSTSGGDILDIRYRDLQFDGKRVSTFPSGRGP